MVLLLSLQISDIESNCSWLSNNHNYIKMKKINFVVINNFSSIQNNRKWKQTHNSALVSHIDLIVWIWLFSWFFCLSPCLIRRENLILIYSSKRVPRRFILVTKLFRRLNRLTRKNSLINAADVAFCNITVVFCNKKAGEFCNKLLSHFAIK